MTGSPPSAGVPLPGSHRDAPADAEHIGPVPPEERIEFTVVLRRRAPLPRDLVEGGGTLSRDELAARFGADPADVEKARNVFESAGLTVRDVDEGARRMSVSGTAGAVNALLGTELTTTRSRDPRGRTVEHRARQGDLRLPASLEHVVLAVLGTDTRPHGRPLLRARAAGDTTPAVAYTPPRLAEVYDFPQGTDGTGRIAAMVEFGGGYDPSDLDVYFKDLGTRTPAIRSVGVAGARNAPGDEGADGEVQLDIEVLGALAPGAELVVYFAPGTDRGYVEAVSAAVHATPTPTVLSISWGAPEDRWTAQSRAALEEAFADAAVLGITVCAAAGDTGSTDGEKDGASHLDYPGSSPHVLSVGGTTLRLAGDPSQGATAGSVADIPAESVWNALARGGGATGGGISPAFPRPGWQRTPAASNGTGRGVPDVAAVADPSTGYQVRVAGKATTLGGTSAAAPLWAALVCRLSQALGSPLGLLGPALYAAAAPGAPAPGLKDITEGDNGAYRAATGWDPCTGLGTPKGAELLAHLAAAAGTGAGARQPPADPVES